MSFLEIFLSIHGLVFLSSWLIGGRWLRQQPSFKLKLARLLLVSCVLSPLIVHCINPIKKNNRPKYLSFATVQEYINQPILKTEPSQWSDESAIALTMPEIKYCQLLYALWALLIGFRAYRLLSGLARLKGIL